MHIPILSILIWLPIIGALAAICIPSNRDQAFKRFCLLIWLLQGSCIGWIWKYYFQIISANVGEQITHNLMFVERIPWLNIPLGKLGTLSIQYFLGIDGINFGFIVLAWVILGIGTIASWRITASIKAYAMLFLSLNATIMGCLATLDLFLFCFFFEMTLIPLYFFIAFWGERKYPQAATIFFLYTFLGSLCMLIVTIGVGISAYNPIATGIKAGLFDASAMTFPIAHLYELVRAGIHNQQISLEHVVHTFDMTLLKDARCFIPGSLFDVDNTHLLMGYSVRLIAFLLFVCGLLIKLAAFPFHSWLPIAHVAAPTPISIVLAGIMLKIGGYGLFRMYSIFPEGAMYYSWWIGLAGIISIIYAGLNALAIQDLKQMVAYSSIAHMGFFLVGMSSLTVDGLQGALYQMISHGLIVSLLFLLVDMLEKRTQDRMITHYSGLASAMPYYTAFTVLTFAAAMGIPGFSSFITEILILLGAFRGATQGFLPWWIGIVCSIGVFLNATYYVQVIQKMFGGKLSLPPEVTSTAVGLQDLTKHEIGLLVVVLLLIIYLGICPGFLLNTSHNALAHLIEGVSVHTN